jgi:hypothetical protein
MALTYDFVFQSLVFTEGFAVTFPLMLLSSEIFHRFVIEKAVGMDATSYLKVNMRCCVCDRRKVKALQYHVRSFDVLDGFGIE